jgi:broad specificity phosphatase PhoE
MSVIYLLRHGATAANRERPYRLQGRHSNHPLDERGIAQARRAADSLSRVSFAAVYTSPLLRARQTAQIVAEPHRLPVEEVPELIEASLGRWEGLTWQEAETEDSAHFHRFMANSGTVPYPGGESFLDVLNRAEPVFVRLAAEHRERPIAVVGHNVLNRAYLSAILGLPIDLARSIRQANGGFNVITYTDSKPELTTLNACLHLLGLET